MSKFEHNYRDLLSNIVRYGECVENRTGVDTKVLFNQQINIDLKEGFPIVTGKKIFFDKAYHEYIWFRDGMVTTKYLKEHNIHWWDQYATESGYLGPTYGYQLRNFNGNFDQLAYAISQIKMNTRRAHISLWNPDEIAKLPLPVCYTSFDFVRINNKLNMSMDFRSSDVFLGLPYDICVGALLLIEVAKHTELEPNILGINLKNAHIYKNHLSQSLKYLKQPIYKLPIYMGKGKLFNYKSGDFIEAPLNN